MARVRLELPERFVFSTELTVRITDINYAGHVGNDSLMSLLQEAREHFFAHHHLRENDVFGIALVVADAIVIYRSEAFQGETLRIDIALADFNKYGFDFLLRVTEKASGREVARAKIGMVFFDYAQRCIQPVPDQFRAMFEIGAVQTP